MLVDVDVREFFRYIFLAVIVFLILAYIPHNKVKIMDVVMLTIIILLTYIIIERLMYMFGGKSALEARCQTTCNALENMQNVEGEGNASPEGENKITPFTPFTPTPSTPSTPSSSPFVISNGNSQIVIATSPNPRDEIVRSEDGTYKITLHRNPQEVSIGGETIKDDRVFVDLNEMSTGYADYNSLPQPDFTKNDTYDEGYSYMMPSKWFEQPAHPPVCVAANRCNVCPVIDNGTTDLKTWYQSCKIMPPAQINTSYIAESLNAGR